MGFTINCGSKSIVFDLEPGVYTAWADSATGKTYTALLLKGVVASGRNDILVLDYERVKEMTKDRVISLIKERKYNVIFADRADRWCDVEIFNELRNSGAIVYADFKENNPSCLAGKDCELSFDLGRIRYYEDDI